MKKIYYFPAVLLFISFSSFGQLSAELYGSMIKNLNKDFKGGTKGAGVRFEYAPGEEAGISYFAGYSFSKAMKTTKTLEAYAMNSWTDPYVIDVNAAYTVPINRFELGSRFYLAGYAQNKQSLNVYFEIRGEYVSFKNKPTYSDYNKDEYSLGIQPDDAINEDGTPVKVNEFLAGLGLGVEQHVGPGNIFVCSNLCYPIFKKNIDGSSSEISSMTPIPFTVSLGYKVFIFRK